MPRKRPSSLRTQRRRDILACAPGLVLQHHGFDTSGQIARHLGLSTAGLRAHVSNEAELVRLLCRTQLDDLFDAVRESTGGLIGISAALLATARTHAARHRIYLLHRFMLPADIQICLAARRALIDNRFHFALHAAAPGKPFSALREPARLLVGQLLHAPLWWPDDAKTSQTAWLALQLGAVAALQRTQAGA